MTPTTCPACRSAVPSGAVICPTCAASQPAPAATSGIPMPGASIDRSQKTVHEGDRVINSGNTTIEDRSVTINHNKGSEWTFALAVVVILGLIVLVLAFGLLNNDRKEPPEPKLNPVEQKDDPPPPPPPAVTPLTVSLNQSSYREGDLMDITIDVPQDGYVYVYAVWADGKVDTLYPNELRPDAFMKAGRLRLPQDLPPAPNGSVMRYPMAMPTLPGDPDSVTESIIAVVSPVPMKPVRAPGGGLGTLSDPGLRTRGPRPTYVQLDAQRLDFTGLPHQAVSYTIRRAASAPTLPVLPSGAGRRVQ